MAEAVITELKLMRAAAVRLMKQEATEAPLLSSWARVLDYLRAAQGYEHREQFRVLFLDKKTGSLPTRCKDRGRSTIRPSMCGR